MESVDIKSLTDEELWLRTEELAARARGATADLVDALAELDERRLPERSVYASLHDYCVNKLLMTDASAYKHIRAARSIRRFPAIGPALRKGRLSLAAIATLHPYLKDPDADALVAAALGKRVYEVEALVAPRRTNEPRKDVVRLIAAAPSPAETSEIPLPTSAEAPPVAACDQRFAARMDIYAAKPDGTPKSPSLPARHAVRIAFTADESFEQLLREVQAAMRHKYPDGRLEGVFRDALRALLKKNRPWAFPKAVRAKRG